MGLHWPGVDKWLRWACPRIMHSLAHHLTCHPTDCSFLPSPSRPFFLLPHCVAHSLRCPLIVQQYCVLDASFMTFVNQCAWTWTLHQHVCTLRRSAGAAAAAVAGMGQQSGSCAAVRELVEGRAVKEGGRRESERKRKESRAAGNKERGRPSRCGAGCKVAGHIRPALRFARSATALPRPPTPSTTFFILFLGSMRLNCSRKGERRRAGELWEVVAKRWHTE